jgi:tRNA nucleotidyltransferase/poly(A) polymerase
VKTQEALDNCKAFGPIVRAGRAPVAPMTREKLSRGQDLVRRAASRVAGLLRRHEVRTLRSIASRLGIRVWLVGGALRDALDGRPAPEVDIAASGSCETLARAMESAGAGTAVALSDASPLVYRIAGPREIDCAELEGGSIDTDLARRDFTVNAMALDLSTKRWIDPFGGAEDLAHRRLRLISEGNLRDDPLRALRAARFLATHRLTADRATIRAVRAVGPRLAEVATERIRVELVKLLEAPRVGPALGLMIRTGLLEPALGASLPRRQRPELARRFDATVLARLSPPQRVFLRLALLASEFGFSPSQAGRWLASRRFSREEAGAIANLLLLAERARTLATSREEWGWIQASGRQRSLALKLLVLTHPAEKGRARRLARKRPPRRSLRVSGGDILAWLGIPPGPHVGHLLREVAIEVLRGHVRSRREARRWLLENQDLAPSDRPKSQRSQA